MENLCTACLSSGRNLYFIRETGFYHLYSQILNEMQVYDISELCIRVCWECRALLRRLQLFKQQVKRSYTELMEYAQNSSKHPQPGTPRLQLSHVNSHNYPEVDIKMEMDDTQFLDDQLDTTADETHCEPETFANELDVEPKKRRKDTKKVVKLSIGTRPSSEQLECLVGFLELNPNIAKGLLRTVSGKVETRQKWDMIATKLSSLDGVKKDGRAWAKYWAEKKFYIKKQLAQLSSSPTSGMLDDMPTLDRRFLAVMGGPRWHGGLTEERCPPVNPTPEPATSELNAEPEIILIETNTELNESVPSTSKIDKDNCENIQPLSPSSSPRSTMKPLFRTAKKKFKMDPNMATFTAIEEKRVQAELISARALQSLSEQMNNIAIALTSIANAIIISKQ